MNKRSQFNQDKIFALVDTLHRAELLTKEEAKKIKHRRELNISNEISGESAERSIISSKIDTETRTEFEEARNENQTQKQIDIIWNILTGES